MALCTAAEYNVVRVGRKPKGRGPRGRAAARRSRKTRRPRKTEVRAMSKLEQPKAW